MGFHAMEMGRITVAVLLAFVTLAPAHAKEVAAVIHDDTPDNQARGSADRFVAKLVDSFVGRALKVADTSDPDLDSATLGKSGHLAMSHPTRTASPALPGSSALVRPPSSLLPARPAGYQRSQQFRKEATPEHHSQRLMCSIQERVDPNSIPGSVKNLKTEDAPQQLGFNDVQVRVYNIDRYGMSPLAAAALKKNIEAIWHVGVAVFGKEYWFGAIVEAQSLQEVDYAFGFGPTHVYNVGTTTMDPEEFNDWVFNVVAKQYGVENYDCFNHNCHHFANDLVVKLTGKTPAEGGFPQWCLDHGQLALSELPDAQQKTITWVSNRIAKVMMISWGKYNRERFVSKGQWTSSGKLLDKTDVGTVMGTSALS